MPARRCMTAIGSRPYSPMISIDREHVDDLQYFRLVDPASAPVRPLLDNIADTGLGQLHQARDHAVAERGYPCDLRGGLAVRRCARRTRVTGHQDYRGWRLGRRGRPSYFVLDHRWLVADHDSVRARDQYGPCAERRQG